MAGARTAWRAWTVIATAYVLVLQLLLVGFASGAAAATASGGHDLSLICSGSAAADASGREDGQAPGHDGASCCTLGCPMAGGSAAPPPVSGWGLPRLGAAHTVPLPPEGVAPTAQRQSAHPARAPPAFA